MSSSPPRRALSPVPPEADDRPAGRADPGMGFRPFVAMMAALMAMNSLAIDSMLTALPDISRTLGAHGANEQQWVITVYLIGFGGAQLMWGPVADRFGRRRAIVVSSALFAAFSLLAAVATSLPLLLAARFLQGIAGASSRTLTMAVIRDCYEGRRMAKVQSLCFAVFLVVPILAPSFGHLVLLGTGTWRAIFFILAAFALALTALTGLFLRETLHPALRRPLSPRAVAEAMRLVAGDRAAVGYTLAGAFIYGSMVGMLTSIEQVFDGVFHQREVFPLVFAAMASGMTVTSIANAGIVERLGSRRVSHAALLGFTAIAAVHLALAAQGGDTMLRFSLLQGAMQACFAMLGPNFNAMAMERMGRVAGTAASVMGFTATLLGAALGASIGQRFDGTVVPLVAGTVLTGLAAIAVVLWTEQWRLFRPHHPDPAPAHAGPRA